jgi:hypothetical protein
VTTWTCGWPRSQSAVDWLDRSGKQVQHAPRLVIRDDRAILLALAEREVVDADRGRVKLARRVHPPHAAQQRVPAGRDAKLRTQSMPGLAAALQPDREQGLLALNRAAPAARCQAGQLLGEDAAPAIRVIAEEPPGAPAEDHRRAPPGQVPNRANVAAVNAA